MKTQNYNPSEMEVKLAQTVITLKDEIEKIMDVKITQTENKIKADNPMVKLFIMDQDGDEHEMILKIIQRPDKY